MANLQTKYMGLDIPTPVIVSSCGLSGSLAKIRTMEEMGAGAIVLKSLFEEQILMESSSLSVSSDYPEALDYIRNYIKSDSLDKYLDHIEKARKAVSIPIIASINCITSADWTRFARKIEEAGAHGLELNVYTMPVDPRQTAETVEKLYLDLAGNIKSQVSIPVSFKLGQHFTNIVGLVKGLYYRKVDGVVLFNRLYSPDIDVENLGFGSGDVFSTPSDIRQSLRWVGIVSAMVPSVDIAASTGVHSGEAVVKQLLAGARAVQVCSTLYKHGIEYLRDIVSFLDAWMTRHNQKDIDSFRGKMNYKNIPDPTVWERSQFMKYFSSLT